MSSFLSGSVYAFLRPILLPFLVALIGIGTPYLVENLGWATPDPSERVEEFEENLHSRIERLQNELEEKSERKELSPQASRRGFIYLGYTGDSLSFWSSNTLTRPERIPEKLKEGPLIEERNGIYYGLSRERKNDRVIGLALIKKEHRYENRYLQDHFFDGSGMPPNARIVQKASGQEGKLYPIEGPDGKTLFRIAYQGGEEIGAFSYWAAVCFAIGGILAFLIFLFRVERRISQRLTPVLGIPAALLILILLRKFTLINKFPALLHDTELFSPTLYAASDWFPTLGDLGINALLLFFVGVFLHRRLKGRMPSGGKWGKTLLLLGATLGVVAFGLWTMESVRSLVENSNIFFDLNRPLQLSAYSLTGLIAIGFLLFTLFLLSDLLLSFTKGQDRDLLIVMAGTVLGLLLFVPAFGIDRMRALLPIVLIGSMAWTHRFRNGRYTFPQTIWILAVFAIFTATIFSFYSSLKEKQKREVLAERLADDEDPVTDLRFGELEDRLKADSIFREALRGERSKEEVRDRLEREYFRGYWNQYRINAYLFDEEGSFVLRLNEESSRSQRGLERAVKKGSSTQLSDHLFYVHSSPDLLNYVGRIPIGKARLYVELMSRQVPREVGFPSLLLRERNDLMEELRNYSYARFLEGRLVDRAGPLSYRRELSAYEGLKEEKTWKREEGHEHLFYRTGEGKSIVLSRPVEGRLAKATIFSYLFIFFSVLLLLLVAAKDLRRNSGNWQLSLNGKIRILMVGITLASVLIFGLVTRSYVRDQYRAKNEQQILEKTRSILLELDDKIGHPGLRPSVRGYTEHTLSELSNVFFSDINLYGPEGRLFATSREKIFEEGLMGRYIHPSAFRALREERRSEFVQKERIGRMEHLSAYMPLSNDEGDLLGYLNLPYFAKQNELEQELSTFFVAILNIFVLLFALSLVAALFISNWVTRPLRRLQESLSRIELGGSNDPLEYHGKDEIGDLVEEYNRKVNELEEKAGALARSEREGAWREMAKQVAHEIKNPLTPMRLQLQQLKRSGKGKDPEQLEKISDRLIERIDALSHIASEFSQFAEMPSTRTEELDLEKRIRDTIELYEGTPDISIDLQKHEGSHPLVLADPDQTTRIFSNLLSNAIEAIPEGEQGRILFRIIEEESFWRVDIEDNGKGIPEDMLERIFEPRFTTRTHGSGIGLAITKNILESIGGKIGLSSEEGVGTCFSVRFPKATPRGEGE